MDDNFDDKQPSELSLACTVSQSAAETDLTDTAASTGTAGSRGTDDMSMVDIDDDLEKNFLAQDSENVQFTDKH